MFSNVIAAGSAMNPYHPEKSKLIGLADELARAKSRYEGASKKLREALRILCIEKAELGKGYFHSTDRVKEVDSLIRKAVKARLDKKITDPDGNMHLKDYGDICGFRVTVSSRPDLHRLLHAFDSLFGRAGGWMDFETIEKDDKPPKLADSFSYGSHHRTLKTVFNDADGEHEIKIEVQLRTELQNAWANISHDRLYKSEHLHTAFKRIQGYPERRFDWERETSRLSALLEGADNAFAAFIHEADREDDVFGAYLNRDEQERELLILEAAIESIPAGSPLLARLQALSFPIDLPSTGEAEANNPYQEVFLRYWKTVKARPGTEDKADWAALQRIASEARKDEMYQPNEGIDTPRHRKYRARLAAMEAYATLHIDRSSGNGKKAARQLALKAMSECSKDPFIVRTLIECHLGDDISQIAEAEGAYEPVVRAAMARCNDLIEMGLEVVDASFTLARLALLLHGPAPEPPIDNEMLPPLPRVENFNTAPELYCRALAIATQSDARVDLQHYLARELRFLTGAGEFGKDDRERRLNQERCRQLCVEILKLAWRAWEHRHEKSSGVGPVIIAGTCDETTSPFSAQEAVWGQCLASALDGHDGKVISGGTMYGVCRLVVSCRKWDRRKKPYGYHSGESEFDQENYHLGHGNDDAAIGGSYGRVLEYWKHLLDGYHKSYPPIHPGQATLLAFGGGLVTRFEIAVAAALGARVAILSGSGRESDAFLKDPRWRFAMNILAMAPDPNWYWFVVRRPDGLEGYVENPETAIDVVASLVHKYYEVGAKGWSYVRPELVKNDFSGLHPAVGISNFEHARAITLMLSRIGLKLKAGEGKTTMREELAEMAVDMSEEQRTQWVADQMECLAATEHTRWTIDKMLAGYRPGDKKDDDARTHTALGPWEWVPAVNDLPEQKPFSQNKRLSKEEKEKDEFLVDNWPGMLEAIGLRVVKA